MKLNKIFFNVFFSIIEIIIGIFCGSATLISNSLYSINMMIDVIADNFLNNKEITNKHIFKSLLSTLLIFSSAIIIIFFSIIRFFEPVFIYHIPVIITSLGIILVNYFFNKEDTSDQKRRFIKCSIIILSSIIMYIFKINFIDNIISIIIAGIIFSYSITNVEEISRILTKDMGDIPKDKLLKEIKNINSVKEVFQFHIYSIEQDLAVSMHIKTKDKNKVQEEINKVLEKYPIKYVTVQYESINQKLDIEK